VNPEVNILDQLFAQLAGVNKLVAPQGELDDGLPSGPPSGESFDQVFDLILGKFPADSAVPVNEDALFAAPEAPLDRPLPTAKPTINLIPSLDIAPIAEQPGVQIPTPEAVPKDPVEGAENPVVLPDDPKLELPEKMLLKNDSLRQLLDSKPIDLQPGKYLIRKTEMVGDSLKLEAVASEAPNSKPIEIRLPAEVLETDIAQPGRVPVKPTTQERGQFARLASKLNLTEIEISQPKTISTPSESKIATESPDTKVANSPVTREFAQPLTVSLTAEGTEQPMQIKARLPKSRVQASVKRGDANHGEGKKPGVPFEPGKSLVAKGNGIVEQVETAQQPTTIVDAIGAQKKGAMARQISTPTPPTSETQLDFAVSDRGRVVAKPIEETELPRMPQPVRFELPEKLKGTLRPNGQSVQIRIHPENLGPARLSLTIHNERLIANLVVDSAESKMVIEGSLDRLVTQLEKADISVDRIEVNVAGEDNQRDHQARRQMWAKTQRPTVRKVDEETLANTVSPPPPPPSNSFVGSSGVNVLA